jgi:hypothetical protein
VEDGLWSATGIQLLQVKKRAAGAHRRPLVFPENTHGCCFRIHGSFVTLFLPTNPWGFRTESNHAIVGNDGGIV